MREAPLSVQGLKRFGTPGYEKGPEPLRPFGEPYHNVAVAPMAARRGITDDKGRCRERRVYRKMSGNDYLIMAIFIFILLMLLLNVGPLMTGAF